MQPTDPPNDGDHAAPEGRRPPTVAVVVPVYNEAENIAPLIDEIRAALDGGVPYEIVYVDDGSTDSTPARLDELAATCPALRVVRHSTCCGQSAAIATGVEAAEAPLIVTLDGDGQNDPADIVKLLTMHGEARKGAETAGPILVAGLRTHRRDTWVKRFSSRVANGVRARLLDDDTPDTGCGLKVFERAAFLKLPRFDHMHRFLPALMLRQGGQVISVAVDHRPRERGTSKYGVLDRLWVGIADLLGVMWLCRRATTPIVKTQTGKRKGQET